MDALKHFKQQHPDVAELLPKFNIDRIADTFGIEISNITYINPVTFRKLVGLPTFVGTVIEDGKTKLMFKHLV